MATIQETGTPAPAKPLRQRWTAALAVAVGLIRLVPHPWNFTPVGAVGLFSGGRLRGWYAFAVPVGLMAFTDLVLWALRGPDFSPLHVSRLFVYPSILLYALIGRALAATESPWRIGLASTLGSLQFFAVTNFGTWLFGLDNFSNPYPKTVEGFLTCYAAAVPFYGYTLLSDFGFSVLLFGAYAVLARTAAAHRPAAAAEY
jgi:hypothetical protein